MTEIVLESDIVKTLTTDLASLALSEGASLIIGNILGTLSPRINNIRLNYKQNRFERYVTNALSLIVEKVDVLEKMSKSKRNPKEIKIPSIKK